MTDGRVWDDFLSEQDRAVNARRPAQRKGFGRRPALLVVDLYRWVFGDQPHPILEVVEQWPMSCGMAAWNALPSIVRMLGEARIAAIPIIHTTAEDSIRGWGEEAIDLSGIDHDQWNRRFELVTGVQPREGEPLIRKSAPSAFWGTPLLAFLNTKRVDTLIVVGESTSGCVRATAVDGRSLRYSVVVVEDCVFDRHEASHAISLFDMNQKYADVIGVDEAVAYVRASALTGA